MNIKGTSLRRLALYVSTHLRQRGIDTVLTGGACVTIYTQNKYLSYDLDFVASEYVDSRKLAQALADIGFVKQGRNYGHPDTPFFVDILAPPLAVGNDPVHEIKEIRSGRLVLKLLSPTDCVKDRLAAFYHWNDLPSLEQALLVARNQKFDLAEVERWSRAEGMEEKFLEFREGL